MLKDALPSRNTKDMFDLSEEIEIERLPKCMMMARHIPERGPKNSVTNSALCPSMSPKGRSDPMGKYNTAAMKHTKPITARIPYIAILIMFSTPFCFLRASKIAVQDDHAS
jgi:hypothetical protein